VHYRGTRVLREFYVSSKGLEVALDTATTISRLARQPNRAQLATLREPYQRSVTLGHTSGVVIPARLNSTI